MELPRSLGLANWQWLFVLEGLPAILLGFLTFKALTDRPEQAAWLADEERSWLITTLAAERAQSQQSKGNVAAAWTTLRDPRVLALALIYSGTSAGLYAVGFWSPLIIHQFGFSPLTIGWINAVPSVIAAVGMLLWARHSDRTLERSWHVAIPCMLGCIGLVWAGSAETAIAVVLALTIVNFGSNAPKGPVWALPSMFLSGASGAAGIAWINSMGNIGGFIGPWLIGVIKQRYGSYAGGLYIVGAMMALSSVLMLLLRGQIERRNNIRVNVQ
jgi:ACS family tartrate transporter-like MFS transporter